MHIVTNSIVKINLSNLPKLSHFREIGETFRKFNRNPSAFPVENFHTRIFMKEPSTPQQVGQYITGDIIIIKQAGGPSQLHHLRGSGSINKNAFLWQITESANDQGKKNRVLTKLVLIQCNLFSLSMTTGSSWQQKPNPNHDLCAGMVARLLGALRQSRRHFTAPVPARDNTEFIRHLTEEQNIKKINN